MLENLASSELGLHKISNACNDLFGRPTKVAKIMVAQGLLCTLCPAKLVKPTTLAIKPL